MTNRSSASFALTLIDRPPVSFIIHTKDRPKQLEQVLRGVNTRLRKHFDEVIIAEGSRETHSKELADQFEAKWIAGPDKSMADGANRGINEASGTFIKILSDDDFFLPVGVAQAFRTMCEHPEIDMLLAGGWREIGGRITPFCIKDGSNYGSCVEDIFTWGSTGVGQFFRRETFDKVGMFSETPIYDFEMALRVIAKGATLKFCRLPTFFHSIRPTGVIATTDLKPIKAALRKEYNARSTRRYAAHEEVWDGGFS